MRKNEVSINWNDKDLKIKWPIKKPIISKKDKNAISFLKFKSEFLKMKNQKILVTGGNGRFAKILKEKNKKLNLTFVTKKDCDILNLNSIIKTVKRAKPKIILHCAGLSRPMQVHENNIKKSIDLNIIGTANITKVCEMFKIKLVYFSSGYV